MEKVKIADGGIDEFENAVLKKNDAGWFFPFGLCRFRRLREKAELFFGFKSYLPCGKVNDKYRRFFCREKGAREIFCPQMVSPSMNFFINFQI
jgi:hypothetical protein